MNKTRCEAVFPPSETWTPVEWTLAIAGEVGDLCNLLKNVRRGDFTLEAVKPEVLNEIADVMTYCDLLITKLGANTDEVILNKFNEVSACMGYSANTQHTGPSNLPEPKLEEQLPALCQSSQSLEWPQAFVSGVPEEHSWQSSVLQLA
jgi:NTP pyrophosphatase (non-canonical NTP hydrolase)